MSFATEVPEHHPVIRAEELSPVLQTPEFTAGFLGVRTRLDFEIGMMPGYQRPSEPRIVTPSRPGFDEEYFEWIDVLESVAEAGSDFVMVELGAGYGRWLMRAAAAARRRGRCQFHGVGVEAEPLHFRWMRQHFRDNDIDARNLELIWAAIGASPGFVPFWVGNAGAWYGQAVAHRAPTPPPDAKTRRVLRARSALGRPPSLPQSGEAILWVPCFTLEEVLAPYSRIDLMDLDIQGLELEVLASGIEPVDAKVRRLHIGTHAPEVEQGLRAIFGARGWQNTNDYACHTRAMTPYGEIQFGDGVQTWLNPKLAPGAPGSRANARPKWRSRRTAGIGLGPARLAEEDASANEALPEAYQALCSRIRELKTRNRLLRGKNKTLRSKLEALREEYRRLKTRLSGVGCAPDPKRDEG